MKLSKILIISVFMFAQNTFCSDVSISKPILISKELTDFLYTPNTISDPFSASRDLTRKLFENGLYDEEQAFYKALEKSLLEDPIKFKKTIELFTDEKTKKLNEINFKIMLYNLFNPYASNFNLRIKNFPIKYLIEPLKDIQLLKLDTQKLMTSQRKKAELKSPLELIDKLENHYKEYLKYRDEHSQDALKYLSQKSHLSIVDIAKLVTSYNDLTFDEFEEIMKQKTTELDGSSSLSHSATSR